MLDIGISSCGFEPIEDYFKALKEAGIKNIELSRAWTEYDSLDYDEIKHLSQKYGVNIWSFHLPFADPQHVDIASLDEEIRQKSVEWWCRLIKTGAEMGVKIFVAHPSSEPISEDPEIRSKNIAAAKKSLKELAEFAAEYDAVIAVEDLPRTCLGRNSDEIAELLSADSRLRVCFDTNHLLIEDNLKFIEKLGNKIVTLHVSDYDFTDEKHWLPGEGKIDWQALYTALIAKGYNGVWMYELYLKTPQTIERPRDLEFNDFIENATQIFENKPLQIKF